MTSIERLELELPGSELRSSLIVGPGLLAQAGDLLREELGRSVGDRVHLVVDRGPGDVVATTHAPVLEAAVRGEGGVAMGLVRAGESEKSITTVVEQWEALAEALEGASSRRASRARARARVRGRRGTGSTIASS